MKVYLSPSDQTKNVYAFGDTNEAEQCGKIARACRLALERNGVEVLVGQYDTMLNRCNQSNSFGADLHVPIHTNASSNHKAKGTRMFYLSEKGKKACEKVFKILSEVSMDEYNAKMENIKYNNVYYELKYPKAPTVYIECEFHDNAESAEWIINNTEKLGEAIAKGICDYFEIDFIEKENEEKEQDKIYRVQVGAFRVRKNADDMAEELKKIGYDAYVK